MNVSFATYQSISLLKGGPHTQLLETKKQLEHYGVTGSLFETWREFQKEKTDLVHLFGAHIGTYHLARELHKIGVPLVVTPIFFSRHSVPFLRAAAAAGRRLKQVARGVWLDYEITREICSWAACVCPNTEAEAGLLTRGLGVPRSKIVVVPNGVSERFQNGNPALFRERYGINDFVLNVGHIGPERKNVLNLIKALENVQLPSVIIGRVERNEYAGRCLAEAKKNPRLVIVDQLSNDADLLASAYAACDVFVLPSQFETPGIAALEAGVAGAKVVVTPYGGTKEYFGDLAEYVDPTSPELIHHGITTALNREKSGALREHIRGHYLWQNVAEQTLAVYKRL
jgi:glycosyltransferase involved in cell wall biosynthesis